MRWYAIPGSVVLSDMFFSCGTVRYAWCIIAPLELRVYFIKLLLRNHVVTAVVANNPLPIRFISLGKMMGLHQYAQHQNFICKLMKA